VSSKSYLEVLEVVKQRQRMTATTCQMCDNSLQLSAEINTYCVPGA